MSRLGCTGGVCLFAGSFLRVHSLRLESWSRQSDKTSLGLFSSPSLVFYGRSVSSLATSGNSVKDSETFAVHENSTIKDIFKEILRFKFPLNLKRSTSFVLISPKSGLIFVRKTQSVVCASFSFPADKLEKTEDAQSTSSPLLLHSARNSLYINLGDNNCRLWGGLA